MRNKEMSQEEKIQQLEELIKYTENNIQFEKNVAIKEYNDNWDDILEIVNDPDYIKETSNLRTPEEIKKHIEDGNRRVEKDKIKFEAEWYKKTSEEIKNLNALKRKLKRLKTEKPKPKLQNIPEFKVEPLI